MSDIANMSEQEAKAELARLAAEIAKSDAAYYQHGWCAAASLLVLPAAVL